MSQSMPDSPAGADVAQILEQVARGEEGAVEALFPVVYDDLRQAARGLIARERAGITLQPTELVHEAYVRLTRGKPVDWQGRTHFFAVGAQVMRRLLVDRARARGAAKRGGDSVRFVLRDDDVLSMRRDEDVLALDAALTKLAEIDPRQVRIVEMRFFGGLTGQEIADVLGVSRVTVQTEWRVVRAWLRRELSAD